MKVKKTLIINGFVNWELVRYLARSTVGKRDISANVSQRFKIKSLISEHSMIREIRIMFEWPSIKSWIATHFSRHMWQPYISTQREDRTGIDRDKLPQDTLVNFVGSMNAQNLIDTSRKRLCYKSHKETRKYMLDLKVAVNNIVDPNIAFVMVPNCVYRGGCPEFESCGHYEEFLKAVEGEDLSNIEKRYRLYNKFYYLESNMCEGV